MSIVDTTITNTATPAQAAHDRIIEINTALYQTCVSSLAEIVTILGGGDGYAPQDVLDTFGTDAASLYKDAYLLIQLILSSNPSYVPPPSMFAYTINDDGTVTVTPPVEVQPDPVQSDPVDQTQS